MHLDLDLLFTDYLYIAHKAERDKIRRFASSLNGRLLDAGCGRKPYVRYLDRVSEYIAMDKSPDVSARLVGNVCAMPFKDKEFDSVICNEVIEHLQEPDKGITEIGRVLKDAGILYMTAPMCWRTHYEPDDYFRFTKYGLEYLLKKNGFEIITMERLGGFFSYIAVRFIDIFVLRIFFPIVTFFGIKRGRYRLAALLTMPASIVFLAVARLLDILEPDDAYGWAVLARRLRR